VNDETVKLHHAYIGASWQRSTAVFGMSRLQLTRDMIDRASRNSND
jgi:hypothetical protein